MVATALAARAATRFSALGTYVHVATDEPAALSEVERVVRDVLAKVDATCSRFRPDSDLSRANASPGRRVPVDPLLAAACGAALSVAHDTDGLVDPLLGRAIVSLGYDRDFARLRPSAVREVRVRPGAWRELEHGEDWVRVPDGTSLDLGSIGKAWASDLAAWTVLAHLGVGVLVSLGGDIAIAQPPQATSQPARPAWGVAVSEHPDALRPDQLVSVDGGGLATSSTRVRRWSSGGVVRHHVLDPRTGLPVDEVWRTVSATGPTCAAANAASTAAVVLGHEALDWLRARSVDARLVAHDGSVRYVGTWPAEEVAA